MSPRAEAVIDVLSIMVAWASVPILIVVAVLVVAPLAAVAAAMTSIIVLVVMALGCVLMVVAAPYLAGRAFLREIQRRVQLEADALRAAAEQSPDRTADPAPDNTRT